jgi:hypothetical protein
MSFEQLLQHMDPCPLCLDISYRDADGVEHLLFDLCEIHQHAAEAIGVCQVQDRL